MGLGAAWFISLALSTTASLCRAADAGPTAGQQTAETLRGPIHEAFLQPLEGSARPGATLALTPPEPLRDYPAAVRPSAKTALWIPGYWSWDEQAGQFAWVVGVWRVPPPGMRWVPGYWSKAGEEWRWVRGFWLPRDQPRLVYLPPPPPPPREEPELAELDGDQFSVPGYWSHAAGRYVWNRGFRARPKQGWAWTPTRHLWTPAGNLLLPGYWDYETTRRGLLFAPLPSSATAQPVAAGPGPLVPKAAVNLASLPELAVEGASYGHDYFDPAKSDAVELTIPVAALPRLRGGVQSVSEIAPESLPRIAQAAERVRLLAVQRSKFESSAAGERTDAALSFYLPPPAEPLNPRAVQTSPVEAGGAVPGVVGRRVPGTGGRNVPGISGRTVPGVDTSLPGVVGPGKEK